MRPFDERTTRPCAHLRRPALGGLLACALALDAVAGRARAEAPGPTDAPPPLAAPSTPALPLPRSSIAAVLARRGALGLDEAQTRALEDRDEALQRETAELRRQLEAPPARGAAGKGERAAAAVAGHGGRGEGGGVAGGPGHGPGRHAERERPLPVDPGARIVELQRRLDDADTAAWLEAEARLPERLREPARAIAAQYREALADRRAARPVIGR